MTGKEKRLLIEKFAERAMAYGYYAEAHDHEQDKKERFGLAVDMQKLSDEMAVLYEVFEVLGITLTGDYSAVGRQRYLETHKEETA